MIYPRLQLRFVFLWILLCWLLVAPGMPVPLQAASGPQPPVAEEDALAGPPSGETVVIDEVIYPIPAPWAGKKIKIPEDTVSNLQKLPLELTLNQTEIYLRREVVEPLKAMATAAKEENIILLVDSGYRSARYQRVIYRQFLEKGQNFRAIARYIAPPGYSEHMLGTVIDFVPSSHGFAKTETYRWLKQHAAAFGFYEAFPRHGREKKPWEPWHWKYRLEIPPAQPPSILPPTTPGDDREGPVVIQQPSPQSSSENMANPAQ